LKFSDCFTVIHREVLGFIESLMKWPLSRKSSWGHLGKFSVKYVIYLIVQWLWEWLLGVIELNICAGRQMMIWFTFWQRYSSVTAKLVRVGTRVTFREFLFEGSSFGVIQFTLLNAISLVVGSGRLSTRQM
jgi:hypothetical protein